MERQMQDIITLNPLYKRDSKGKVRVWQIQVGSDNENIAGIRSTSGLVDGEKITSVWNMSVPKNIGRANATTAKTQAEFEAQDALVELLCSITGIQGHLAFEITKKSNENPSKTIMKETINHPPHYGGESNPYETIKVIEAWKLDFHLGNILKYISRAGIKSPSQLEDLEKALWYLKRKIQNTQRAEN